MILEVILDVEYAQGIVQSHPNTHRTDGHPNYDNYIRLSY